MDIVVFIFYVLLASCYGYNSSSNTSNLVLTDSACFKNNNNSFKYEPVTWSEVRRLENEIKELLDNGEEIRLGDYGMIKELSLKCFKFDERSDNEQQTREIRKRLTIAMEHQDSLQQLLKSNSAYIGYFQGSCSFVPIRSDELLDCFKRVDEMYCSKQHSTDHFNASEIKFMYLIAHDHGVNSFHVICEYVVSFIHAYMPFRNSYCGLRTDGTICEAGEQNDSTCEYLEAPICVTTKQVECWTQICPGNGDHQIKGWLIRKFLNIIIGKFMSSKNHTLYNTDRRKLTILDVYNTPRNGTKCISVLRYVDRLFVNTINCSIPMRHLCSQIPYNDINPTPTGNHTLFIAFVGIGVFIVIILTAVVVFLILRRYLKLNNCSSSVNIPLGSQISGGLQNVPLGSQISGGLQNVPLGSQVSGGLHRGGSVCSWASVDSSCLPTEGGEVPGRFADGHINSYI